MPIIRDHFMFFFFFTNSIINIFAIFTGTFDKYYKGNVIIVKKKNNNQTETTHSILYTVIIKFITIESGK